MIPAWLSPTALSALRIVAGLNFMTHGTQKLFSFPVLEPRAAPELFSLFWFAGVIESVGGLLIAIGLFTRPAALVAALEMAVAYARSHLPNGPWPILNGGELAMLYCFIWVYLCAAGPGPWSLDAVVRRRPSG